MPLDSDKISIGLTDVLAVLLPGAILAYLLKESAAGLLPLTGADATEKAIVFAVCAYLLGQFVFVIGAWILDTGIYDVLRAEKPDSRAFGKSTRAMAAAVRIKDATLGGAITERQLNAFQWAKAVLTLDHPAAMTQVERFEANSKLFRSLVAVLLFAAPWYAAHRDWTTAGWCIPLIAMSVFRYWDQRNRSISQACWFIITLDAQRAEDERVSAPPTHAGGVVFRRDRGEPQFLLVQASRDEADWVLPKGHIEPGETPQRAAVREVCEESGVCALILQRLPSMAYTVREEAVRVQLYLMERAYEVATNEKRQPRWLPLADAVALTRHEEIKARLRLAQRALGDA